MQTKLMSGKLFTLFGCGACSVRNTSKVNRKASEFRDELYVNV